MQSRLAEIERLLGSDPHSADKKATELLQTVPGEPMAQLYQGIARRMLGNPAAAVDVLRPRDPITTSAPNQWQLARPASRAYSRAATSSFNIFRSALRSQFLVMV